MALASLPLQTLQQIAADIEKVHRPSFYALNLTIKVCYRALAFLFFRQINTTVHRREALQRDVNSLVKALFRSDSAHHVQRIRFKGALRLKARKRDIHGQKAPYWVRHDHNEILADEKPIDLQGPHVVHEEGVIEESEEEDMAWPSVVSLLQAIFHLRDLVYDCQSQFPPSLLRALRDQHPQCRLHRLTFRFRALLWSVPQPYEMELATSPSLFRVKLVYGSRDTNCDVDFNLKAIMELVSQINLNISAIQNTSKDELVA